MSTIEEEHLGVVIVDDDATFRDIICATLKTRSRFVVFEAKSGDELVALLEQQSIDCIVLDYDLGLETGLTVKQRIEDSSSERVPIVMLTGDGRESTAIRAFRMGVADYLPKRGLEAEHLVRMFWTSSGVVEESAPKKQNAGATSQHHRLTLLPVSRAERAWTSA